MSEREAAWVAAELAPFRMRLDEIDEQIVALFAQRFAVCREIAEHKREQGIPMMQHDRVAEVRAAYELVASELGVPAGFISRFLDLMIGATCEMEDSLMALPDPGESEER